MTTFNFILVMPDGQAINQNTKLFKNGIAYKIFNNSDLCDFMKRTWRLETGAKSFTDWATSLNETGEFEGKFQMEDGLDNLSNLFFLNIDNKHVDIYEFFQSFKPFKSTI